MTSQVTGPIQGQGVPAIPPAAVAPAPRRRWLPSGNPLLTTLKLAVLLACTVIFIYPLLWAVSASVKDSFASVAIASPLSVAGDRIVGPVRTRSGADGPVGHVAVTNQLDERMTVLGPVGVVIDDHIERNAGSVIVEYLGVEIVFPRRWRRDLHHQHRPNAELGDRERPFMRIPVTLHALEHR